MLGPVDLAPGHLVQGVPRHGLGTCLNLGRGHLLRTGGQRVGLRLCTGLTNKCQGDPRHFATRFNHGTPNFGCGAPAAAECIFGELGCTGSDGRAGGTDWSTTWGGHFDVPFAKGAEFAFTGGGCELAIGGAKHELEVAAAAVAVKLVAGVVLGELLEVGCDGAEGGLDVGGAGCATGSVRARARCSCTL